MKPFTEKQREWLWFAGLWCGGLAAALALAQAVRWALSI
jgi:hypothetical protein